MMTYRLRRSNVLSVRPNSSACGVCLILLALMTLCGCSVLSSETEEDINSPAAGMLQLASQMQARGDNVAAQDFYQRALQRDPGNVKALKGMAYVQDQLGNVEGAAAYYQDALKTKPHDAELRRGYGKVLLALDRPSEARDQFKEALDADGDDARAMNGLGIALDHLGEHEAAQEQFRQALEKEPGNLTTINNLAYSYVLVGKYDEAIKLLEPEQYNPKATSAIRQNLALAYGLAGMDMDAERVAKMDLPPQKVKENLDYYKRQRAELKVSTTPYAELGTYSTEALALAQIDKLRAQFQDYGEGLKPVILPEVAAPGGTPRFAVRMMGCRKPADLKVFCDQLAKKGIPCVTRRPGSKP